MKVVVGDLEANGLLAEVTIIHCGVFKDINSGEVRKFRPTQMKQMVAYLKTVDVLIMHNGIGYDFPLQDRDWETLRSRL